jgi:hypothetical protein
MSNSGLEFFERPIRKKSRFRLTAKAGSLELKWYFLRLVPTSGRENLGILTLDF